MTTALIVGYFSQIHPGHLNLLEKVGEFADKVHIGLIGEGIHKYQEENVRLLSKLPRVVSVHKIVKSIEPNFLNESIELSEEIKTKIIELIRLVRPDLYIKGKEFESMQNFEEPHVRDMGGRMVFLGNSDILRSSAGEKDPDTKSLLSAIRHFSFTNDFSQSIIRDFLEKLKRLQILVIGDTIIDRYTSVVPVGMSREEPSLVMSPTNSIDRLGGAAIVALHAASLGVKVNFITALGEDLEGDFAKLGLNHPRINSYICTDPLLKTNLKTRFRVGDRSVFRLNRVNSYELDLNAQVSIMDYIRQCGSKGETYPETQNRLDGIVFADFNYGCLPDELIERIILYAHENNVKMFADCQSSSQYGNILKYQGAHLLTPTLHEIRLALQDSKSGLTELLKLAMERSNAENVIMTLGEEGMIGASSRNLNKHGFIDFIPSLNNNPVDTSGAGDAAFIGASLALMLENDLKISMYIGSVLAAVNLTRLGNQPISAEDLITILP